MGEFMNIRMNLQENSYDIVVENGVLNRVEELLNLNRKVLVVTDTGVPSIYADKVLKKSKCGFKIVIPQGEESKNFDNYKMLLEKMVKEGFTRGDCVVAVGGGVVGDLSGFVASSYMRGVDFYNIPTTLLSQIDSSIGGKVAIDFMGFKNIVGAFYQPKKVLIDPLTLETLSKRQFNSGLSEAIKMSLTSDKTLFDVFKYENVKENLQKIIVKSLLIKKNVVEQDEKEQGLRMILNFGHTIGHGIESQQKGKLFHGECVALGMIPMCSESVRKDLVAVLEKNELLEKISIDKAEIMNSVLHDKKFRGNNVTIIKVNEIGKFVTEQADAKDLEKLIDVLEEVI